MSETSNKMPTGCKCGSQSDISGLEDDPNPVAMVAGRPVPGVSAG